MAGSPFPYSDIIAALVRAVMRAQRDVLREGVDSFRAPKANFAIINRHFSWLPIVVPQGRSRHLVDYQEGQFPLRVNALRNPSVMPDEIRESLINMRTPPSGIDSTKYVQAGRTRIASLILQSITQTNDLPAELATSKEAVYLASPLSIVLDFLTVPELPGTRAYALLACRNYLFTALRASPALVGKRSENKFDIADLEDALSHVWTSLRPRFNSRGKDTLPIGAVGQPAAVVRHFLAMRNILLLRFRTSAARNNFLETESIAPENGNRSSFDFSASPYLERLPEVGELINELWGMPLPIRGADTIFRGGIKFSANQGLVMAIHGGPGSGKTSLALALAAYTVPLGIQSLFLTAEESQTDLANRMVGLVPDTIRRLAFYPDDLTRFVSFVRFDVTRGEGGATLDRLENELSSLASTLTRSASGYEAFTVEKPCRYIVVLDGLHDLFADEKNCVRLYRLLDTLRQLRALVILTTGLSWSGDTTLDYLVDIAIRLSYEAVDELGAKPDRRFTLSKARHQLCASGTHGLQIAGTKGVRFSPQINYHLERRAIWKAKLPNDQVVMPSLRFVQDFRGAARIEADQVSRAWDHGKRSIGTRGWKDELSSIDLFEGAHIFINGLGSGGKAALALKIALTPKFRPTQGRTLEFLSNQERVLVISFLYPSEYYAQLFKRLIRVQRAQYHLVPGFVQSKSRFDVIHLYPGHLKPTDLYNRIEWDLEAAELNGDPYSCIVIDGIHNVFLQFPEIEKYQLFWPQIYSLLRSRSITTISTHTTLNVPHAGRNGLPQVVDDARSEPLRHALVQKTDFQLEVNELSMEAESRGQEMRTYSHLFRVQTISAIRQKIPRASLLWSRERLVLYDFPPEIDRAMREGRHSEFASLTGDQQQLSLVGTTDQGSGA